ncbi:glycoside hydrolase family 16 protein [Sporormia fimetaria CBS 119925]|uniref:endo-1,3(4)-beta-glucanase n=1 Tax=Sporormia fimetaria CBS 119925 TaxID=1340428 RepID=A0A6A6V1R7_9PLEO|nr:glycoside hydrolase family 16 protein [Sporormia fimetaria CBS 119925]
MTILKASATLLTLLTAVSAQPYTLHTDLSADNFFPNFDLYSGPDPTKGFVRYQDASSAINENLIAHLNGSVYLGVDFTTRNPSGRASVRMESKPVFNHGLLIADIKHMPANECGTWPAFWMLGKETWPKGGEIDILEGVNDQEHNAVTLHTDNGCVVDNSTFGAQFGGETVSQAPFTGLMETDNCDVKADKNKGCSIKAPEMITLPTVPGGGMGDTEGNGQLLKLPSYGTPFNNNNGGVYAMEWTPEGISTWFFARNAPGFPTEEQLTMSPDPLTWGAPIAKFAGRGCDFEEKFKDLRIIFNTAFCGEWAGNEDVWGASCKAKTGVDTCEEYVRENPEVFAEAYWEIAGLRWFEKEAVEKREVMSRSHARHFG